MGNETRAYVILVSEATVGFEQESVVTCFTLKFQKVKIIKHALACDWEWTADRHIHAQDEV